MLEPMLWWILIATAAVVSLSLYGLFRWVSADAGVDAEIARERFRVEQDLRASRRSGTEAGLAPGRDQVRDVR